MKILMYGVSLWLIFTGVNSVLVGFIEINRPRAIETKAEPIILGGIAIVLGILLMHLLRG